MNEKWVFNPSKTILKRVGITQMTSSSDGHDNPCSHEWTMTSDKCVKCGADFEEYRSKKERVSQYNYQCECGAAKSGFDTHSHYCPRYKKT